MIKLTIHPSHWIKRLSSRCAYRAWLTDQGSLTRRIQERCNEFSVRNVRLDNARVSGDEAIELALKSGSLAMQREVFLYCGEIPVVFAHSVLPLSSLRGPWQTLMRLGAKPLGAALFSNPQVTRTALQFKKLKRHHALYRLATAHLPNPPHCLWARRSVFSLHNKSILVTEVFLPNILHL